MPASTVEKPVFGDEAVRRLAQKLYETALIDPADLLARLSDGTETPLPEFYVEGRSAPTLRSWDSVQRATPAPLTAAQYEQFLEGRSVSAQIGTSDPSLYLDREVVAYLRESRRDWIIFASVSAISATIAVLVSFTGISSVWLGAITALLGFVAGFGFFRTAKQSRSLKLKNQEVSARARVALQIKTSG